MLRLVLVLVILGVAVYVTIRVAQRGGTGGTGGTGGPRATQQRRPPPPPPRPQGPDDDDDFLRDLDRRRLHPEDPDGRPDA